MVSVKKNEATLDQLSVGSSPFQYHGQVELVLLDTGQDPASVSQLLGEIMSIAIGDPAALEEAVPLVLFESLARTRAEQVRSRLHRAGARVLLRVPRQPAVGLRRPSSIHPPA